MSESLLSYFIRVIGSLAVVSALFYVFVIFYRRHSQSTHIGSHQLFEVVCKQNFAPGQSLLLIRCAGKYYFFHFCRDKLELIDRLSPAEIAEFLSEPLKAASDVPLEQQTKSEEEKIHKEGQKNT
jgi:hypothetical protein